MTAARPNDDIAPAAWFPDLAPPGWAVAGIAALLVAGASDVLRAGLGEARFSEGGALELASAAGYLLALAVFAARALRPGRCWPVPVLLLAGAARELDLDKRLTDPGLLQARLYTGDAPLAVKLAGLAVVLAILGAALVLVVRDGPGWVRALAAGARRAWWAAAALGLAIVSKSLDGVGRKLRPLGIEVTDALDTAAALVEEVLELGIPVAIVLAMTARPNARARGAEDRAGKARADAR